MLRSILSAFLLLCVLVPLTAQEPGGATDQKVPLSVQFVATGGVLRIGQPLALEMTIGANAEVEIPASVLSGLDLDAAIDGRKVPTVHEGPTGKVKLVPGVALHRTFSLDPATLWKGFDLGSARQITLDWVGLAGAHASLRVVPDQHDLDLAKLDLQKTTVRLITSKGEVVIGFMPDVAPKHVVNFITLAKDGFYDGTRFHRIISGFMAQGGDPNTKVGATGMPGTGGSGHTIQAEFSDVKHVKGIVSMARSASPDSASSQFFLMHGDAPHLDGKYSAFGRITPDTLPVLDAICGTPVRPSPQTGEPSVPTENVWLFAAVVEPVFKQ
ncbi:MAG: peptidylprolyl isomerase [Planctomycetota bacterium]